jgi:hypothetical protein
VTGLQFLCNKRRERMSHLQQQLGRRPLVSFATTNRARLVGSGPRQDGIALPGSTQMPAVTRKRSAAAAKRRRGGSNKVRFVKGRVQLRVAGYAGTRYISPAHLVRHISAAKLRLAAKHVLKKSEKSGNSGKKRKRKTRKRKRRRGKKKKKKRRRR